MHIVRERLPALSDVLSVAGLVTLIAYSWTLLGAFNKLPSWILIFSVSELAGIFAYALLVSLLDSVLVMMATLLIGFLMPPQWICRDFIAKGGILVIIFMGSPVLFHFMGQNFYEVSNAILFLVIILVLVFAACLFLLLRVPLFRRGICFLVERSRIFLYIYLPLSALALLIVIIRNI